MSGWSSRRMKRDGHRAYDRDRAISTSNWLQHNLSLEIHKTRKVFGILHIANALNILSLRSFILLFRII